MICCGISGFSSVGDSGSNVLVRRPNSRCAGEAFVGNVGVLRWFNSARCMSDLANCAFFRRALHIFTALSALPLACG